VNYSDDLRKPNDKKRLNFPFRISDGLSIGQSLRVIFDTDNDRNDEISERKITTNSVRNMKILYDLKRNIMIFTASLSQISDKTHKNNQPKLRKIKHKKRKP